MKNRRNLTVSEEAEIQRRIASDPDAPEATDEQLTLAKPFAEVFPELAERMSRNVGGRPKAEATKVAVSLRLDPEVLEKFKAGGPGWQSRMNRALRESVGL